MAASKTKKFTYFIGIDVSRNELDYAVMHGKTFLFHREAKNTEGEVTAFVAELKSSPGFRLAKAESFLWLLLPFHFVCRLLKARRFLIWLACSFANCLTKGIARYILHYCRPTYNALMPLFM